MQFHVIIAEMSGNFDDRCRFRRHARLAFALKRDLSSHERRERLTIEEHERIYKQSPGRRGGRRLRRWPSTSIGKRALFETEDLRTAMSTHAGLNKIRGPANSYDDINYFWCYFLRIVMRSAPGSARGISNCRHLPH